MPSPFPGMDPFIEGQMWQDFHIRFINDLADLLTPEVRPRYVVEIENRQQKFLSIRDRQSRNVVTIIELLSPWNKSLSGGSDEYLVKRSDIFQNPSHLVELELLRGGQRLATREPLAPADYYAFVCRKQRLPRVEVYSWTLRDRLPVIPVPLASGDADVPLNLQAAFTKTYDRTGYDYSLDYRSAVEPPLEGPLSEWVRSVAGT